MSPEQRRIRFYLTNEFGLLVLIFVFGIAFTLVTPRFLSHFNLFILGRTAAVNIVVGFSMMVVIVTGGLDLSVGSIGVCAAMAGGWLMQTAKRRFIDHFRRSKVLARSMPELTYDAELKQDERELAHLAQVEGGQQARPLGRAFRREPGRGG